MYLSTNAFSQVQNQGKLENADALFNLAAAKHKRELNNLILSRSVDLIYINDASAKSIARVLGTRSERWSYHAGYPENTALLFYSYEQDNISVWLVDKSGIKAYSKRKISEQQINVAISNLRSSLGVDSLQLSRAPRLKRSEIVYLGTSPKISLNETIKNITDILIPASIANELTQVEHLIVVPVLGIGSVPYAILKPFKTDSFLIDKMSITIAPSLFDLGQTIEPWDSNFDSPLVVGNPYLPPNSKWIVPSLPGAEEEAREVAKLLNTKALVGKEATKQAILSQVSGADFLYFASHGIADSKNPLLGGFLMLSAPEFEEGWWTAKEIQDFHKTTRANSRGRGEIRTKLVVLSACQTGLGKVHDAGIIGLARAFQIAGVPRVVMSLWSVDDAATNQLMQAFMRHLLSEKRNTPSEALRQAMLEVKKQHSNPSEWASFVVFGTSR
jgi:CHAT domain-containing protein